MQMHLKGKVESGIPDARMAGLDWPGRWEVMKRGSRGVGVGGNCVHLLDEMAVAARLVVSSERKMSDGVTCWLRGQL